MPAFWQATGVGLPCAIETSIWRRSITICSALNLFFGITQAPFQAHSLTTFGSKNPGQVAFSFQIQSHFNKTPATKQTTTMISNQPVS
jgi:hypothetical protein